MTRVYAFANQKGGVGKTTTAVNLGAYVAAADRHVLIVDADPQANATSSLGVDATAARYSVYDTLIRHQPLEDVILETAHPRLALAPSTPEMAGAEVEMVSILAREHLLRKALEPVVTRYDYIFIDCPPSLGLLTVNALTAARDGVMVPIQCEYLALEGLGRLWQTIQLVRENLNPHLTISGMILTMFDGRTNLAAQVVREVRTHFPEQTFRTIVPRSIRLSEAPSYGRTILAYAPSSTGGLAYAALAQELLAREEAAGSRAYEESTAAPRSRANEEPAVAPRSRANDEPAVAPRSRANDEPAVARDLGTRDLGTRDLGTRDVATQDPGTRNPGTQALGIRGLETSAIVQEERS